VSFTLRPHTPLSGTHTPLWHTHLKYATHTPLWPHTPFVGHTHLVYATPTLPCSYRIITSTLMCGGVYEPTRGGRTAGGWEDDQGADLGHSGAGAVPGHHFRGLYRGAVGALLVYDITKAVTYRERRALAQGAARPRRLQYRYWTHLVLDTSGTGHIWYWTHLVLDCTVQSSFSYCTGLYCAVVILSLYCTVLCSHSASTVLFCAVIMLVGNKSESAAPAFRAH